MPFSVYITLSMKGLTTIVSYKSSPVTTRQSESVSCLAYTTSNNIHVCCMFLFVPFNDTHLNVFLFTSTFFLGILLPQSFWNFRNFREKISLDLKKKKTVAQLALEFNSREQVCWFRKKKKIDKKMLNLLYTYYRDSGVRELMCVIFFLP